MDIDRVLPHNMEAERAVLGTMLISEQAIHVAFAVLTPRDFYRSAHGRLFAAMLVLAQRGVSPDMITIKEELSRTGSLEEVGGPAYIASLSDGVPRSTNVQHYAEIIREKSRLRWAITHSNELLADAYMGERPALELVADLSKRLAADIGTSAARPVTAHAAATEYTTELDAGTQLLPTGYADVDNLLGGIAISDLIVVAARPSVGKTTLTLGIAKHIAKCGHTAAYFSLEMKRSKMAARLLSWDSQVQTISLERQMATEVDHAKVLDAYARLEGLPLYIDDNSRTLVEIDAWCRRLRDETGNLSAVFIDYLQLLVPETRHGTSRQEEVASISRGLKRLAKDLGIAVVALSQLSRAPEGRADKRPHLSDLRESGALEQDADVALLLFRPEMHKPTDENHGIAEVIVAKNRTGPVGVTQLFFQESLAQFRDLARNVF